MKWSEVKQTKKRTNWASKYICHKSQETWFLSWEWKQLSKEERWISPTTSEEKRFFKNGITTVGSNPILRVLKWCGKECQPRSKAFRLCSDQERKTQERITKAGMTWSRGGGGGGYGTTANATQQTLQKHPSCLFFFLIIAFSSSRRRIPGMRARGDRPQLVSRWPFLPHGLKQMTVEHNLYRLPEAQSHRTEHPDCHRQYHHYDAGVNKCSEQQQNDRSHHRHFDIQRVDFERERSKGKAFLFI